MDTTQIDILYFLPCRKCGWQSDYSFGECCSGPETPAYEMETYPEDEENLLDTDSWNEIVKRLKEAAVDDFLPAEFQVNEFYYYCPKCEKLELFCHWQMWYCAPEPEYACSRPPKCECGTEMKQINDTELFRDIVIHCPHCNEPLPEIMVKYPVVIGGRTKKVTIPLKQKKDDA